MSEVFTRLPIDHGDSGVWAAYYLANLTQLYGTYTSKLYASAGALYVSAGKIGIFDGTNKGVVDISAAKLIDLSGCSASNWCKIEMTVSGAVATFTASDITGATNAAALPSDFKDAFLGVKCGFYITATKRTIGLAWLNASGVLEGVVNCLPGIDGWIGYSQSDDADDIPYIFEKHTEANKAQEGERVFNEKATFNKEVTFVLSPTFSQALKKSVTYRTSVGVESVKNILTKIVEIGDWNMDTTDLLNVSHGMGSDYTKIRNIKATIIQDGDAYIRPLDMWYNVDSSVQGGIVSVDNTLVILHRKTGGIFDTTSFDSTSFNRGWIYIEYEE